MLDKKAGLVVLTRAIVRTPQLISTGHRTDSPGCRAMTARLDESDPVGSRLNRLERY
jgi:hypothetical protein